MSNDTAAEELVAPTSWMCVATKSDNGLSAKVEIYHGNMKATTGERPHVKIMAASKANDVQVYYGKSKFRKFETKCCEGRGDH